MELWKVTFNGKDGKPVDSLHDAESAEFATASAIERVKKLDLVPEPFAVLNITSEGAKGYQGEVIADNSGQWVGNQLTFATVKEAGDYVYNLASRWMMVQSTRVVPSPNEPTHFWSEDGKLGNLDRPEDARHPARSVQL